MPGGSGTELLPRITESLSRHGGHYDDRVWMKPRRRSRRSPTGRALPAETGETSGTGVPRTPGLGTPAIDPGEARVHPPPGRAGAGADGHDSSPRGRDHSPLAFGFAVARRGDGHAHPPGRAAQRTVGKSRRLVGRRRGGHPPGRADARCRQDRHSRRHSSQAGPADSRRNSDHANPHDHRRRDFGRLRLADAARWPRRSP